MIVVTPSNSDDRPHPATTSATSAASANVNVKARLFIRPLEA
jgi:hypothetical protein